MTRDKAVKLSEEEKKLLDEVTEQWFGSNEVPYGYVIERLCMEKLALFDVAEQYEGGNYVYQRHIKFHEPDDKLNRTSGEGVNE